MPWKIFTEDGQYCVYRMTEGGEQVKRLECYDAEQAAKDYMAALYANEPEAAKAAVRKKEQDGLHPASHYLVVEDPEHPSTWHLRVRNASGDLDHRLMGAAWAALTDPSGHRGRRYGGPGKKEAIAKLRRLYSQEDMETPGESVKAIKGDDGEWLLDVRGVPYGGPLSKDSDGEYFTEDTELWLDRIPKRPVIYYHGMNKSGRPDTTVIGEELGWERRPDGVWFRVALDKTKALARQVWEAANEGMARASSAAMIHLREVATDGRIVKWPIGELSLMDTRAGHMPANTYAVALPAMKAAFDQAGIAWPDGIDDTDTKTQTEGEGTTVQSLDVDWDGGIDNVSTEAIMSEENVGLTAEQVAEIAAKATRDALQAEREAEEAARKEAEEREKEIEDAKQEAVKAAQEEWTETALKGGRLPFTEDDAPTALEFGELRQFDNHTTGDLAFAMALQDAAYRRGICRQKPGESVKSQLAMKAIAVRMVEDKDPSAADYGFHAAIKAAGLPLKSNELMRTTYTSYGDEWIGVAYSRELWEAIRFGTPVLQKMETRMREIPDGMESITLPTEGTDPTWYNVSQATTATSGRPDVTVTASKHTTSNVSLSVGKLGARVMWSGEMDEDSLIRYAPDIRRRMEVSGAEHLEALLIDGDTATTASTNINDIAGTPSAEFFLVLNGFRKACLVTNTANSRSGGAIDEDDFIETLKLLGAGGREGMDPKAVSFIVDPVTNFECLRVLDVLKTRDVYSRPTIEGNKLAEIWGYPVIVSAHMMNSSMANTGYEYKSESTGKIDLDTASDNTKGQILAVRWDKWYMAYKRRMTIEVDRWPEADANQIVAICRVGLTPRNSTTPEGAAISYNLSV